MTNKKQNKPVNRSNLLQSQLSVSTFGLVVLLCLLNVSLRAVSSKVTRHSSAADLLKGEVENVVIGSRGTIELAASTEPLVESFEDDVWSINSIVISAQDIFFGTSPNGGIYKYSSGELAKIYPVESDEQNQKPDTTGEANDSNEPNDANAVEIAQHLTNEHIFAMAKDMSGRVLAGISGKRCALARFELGQMKTIFEPNDANYIFAIAVEQTGDIYLGTGPKGKVYKLNSLGENPELIYDSPDKNILSLAAAPDGSIYAGSDTRGLIYKINPANCEAFGLYDADQDEITSLLFLGDGPDSLRGLYAAATSAKITKPRRGIAAKLPMAGRPETPKKKGKGSEQNNGDLNLKIPNISKDTRDTKPPAIPTAAKKAKPSKASFIYKITGDGFVTDIFKKTVVLFALAARQQDDKTMIIAGTGNDAQLFAIDLAGQAEAVLYEDKQACQITAIALSGRETYFGTANPAKLIKLNPNFAGQGSYTSQLIDAGQPAKWGKFQIEADIPQDCSVQISSRSGNVKDINDPTFSDWTKPAEITGPHQLRSPVGRFCQYKLFLKSNGPNTTPIVREIAVANTVSNLEPKVESVEVTALKTTGKKGIFEITYKAEDDNNDKLIYKIDFRKLGRTSWIEIKDEEEKANFEWDGKTVEDGRYEIKVTASDERSNTGTTKLTGTRISDPVVVDNTGPVIGNYSIEKNQAVVTIKLNVTDKLSAIGQLHYTIDSNADWIGTLPDDLVYDTKKEDFTIVTDELETAEHVITVKVSDDSGNTTYKTFEVNI
ncbi:MAG: hypothetical protein JXB29_06035 [Sedimentisphaerales bacterium]|nr:hypothetical protein [Sedimentisphaerales bacterium]